MAEEGTDAQGGCLLPFAVIAKTLFCRQRKYHYTLLAKKTLVFTSRPSSHPRDLSGRVGGPWEGSGGDLSRSVCPV